MSIVKNPEEKKFLSLKHDRRNTYGENAKASRRLIPRGKQLSSKAARASVAQALQMQSGPVENLDMDSIESLVKVRTIKSKRERFKKRPDTSLSKVLLLKKSKLPLWAVTGDPLLPSASMPAFDRAIKRRQSYL